MSVPKDILAVPRPTNSVVYSYGKNNDKYLVRERIGCKYKDGRRIPVTGKTIGHIVNAKFEPLPVDEPKKIEYADVSLKDWANVMLCLKQSDDLLDELKLIYHKDDSKKILAIAILRVCYPGITDCELKDYYEHSFLSEELPDVALSKNSVSDFMSHLGSAADRIAEFMKNRANKVKINHHLLIDGTLKTNNSKVNSLCDFSYKSRVKGTRDISVLFAFDLEEQELICSECFPGNMLDVNAYKGFISRNNITSGIIVGDKGFPSSSVSESFVKNPKLHYINPIKRNAKLIETHNLLAFDTVISIDEGKIRCRKAKVSGKNKWVYAYHDHHRAYLEEDSSLTHHDEDYLSPEEFDKKQKTFGLIVLESDLDLPLDLVYMTYQKRWEIEIVMRFYKNACEFTDVREHSDWSVLGSEFCDFIASVITQRLLKKFKAKDVLKNVTYKKIMRNLRRAKKIKLKDNKEWN